MDRSQSVVEMGDRLWDDRVFSASVSTAVADALSGDGTGGNWPKLAADLGGGVEFEAIGVVGNDGWVGAGVAARCDDGKSSDPCVELSVGGFFDLKTSEAAVFAGGF